MPTIKINLTEQQVMNLCNNGEIVINFGVANGQQTVQGVTVDSMPQTSFFDFIQKRADQLEQAGSQRTAETYRTVLNQFRRFREDEDLPLSAVTMEIMEQYQAYLRSRNLTMNTVSFQMRILRAVYHHGVHSGLVTDGLPFRNVYTGNAKTQKRALTLEQMQRIKNLKLTDQRQAFARDMFMLSFYLRGMSFIDMAYLKHSDLHDGQLAYKRRKTGQMLTIRWEKQMQAIVDRYSNSRKTTTYLLPIIKKENGKERNQYRHIQTLVNKQLKEIAQQVNITMPLTMYCARHTWATVARDMQVPMSVISRAMGHTNERTTEIYLRSIDVSNVDKANEKIMEMV